MMNKKLVLGLMLFMVVMWLVLSVISKEKTKKNNVLKEALKPTIIEEKNQNVTPVPTIEQQEESDTGGDVWIVSDEQQKIDKEELDLENKVPIETDSFKLIFDYDVKVFSFVVNFKINQNEGLNIFKKWLVDNDYGDIPMNQFVIK